MDTHETQLEEIRNQTIMSYGRNEKRTAEEVNDSGQDWYTLYTVLSRRPQAQHLDSLGKEAAKADLSQLHQQLEDLDVIVRGFYDVSAMRADSDILVWLTGHIAEDLQAGVRKIRRSDLFAGTEITFSAMGVHREAEFTKSHVPAYARGVDPEDWLVVYPFNRSYDWYLMDPKKRGMMLREHGLLGQEFPSVLANTTSAFALNDWEWLLALESPKLSDLVDMMRKLRESETRYHVRDETPFYTGRRITQAGEIREVLL